MTADDFRKMRLYRRARRYLSLRLFDVRAATAIPESKLSAAESGRRRLTKTEEGLLVAFLKARLDLLRTTEGARTVEIIEAEFLDDTGKQVEVLK